MSAKVFEVGDVLPATTQLRISWNTSGIGSFDMWSSVYVNNNTFKLCEVSLDPTGIIEINGVRVYSGSSWISPYTSQSGNHNYMIIDTSSWSEAERTISNVSYSDYSDNDYCYFYWEDLAPAPSGYSITFEENGGSTVTDLSEQTALPSPLPTTTKANHVFAGWYYDNLFTQKANAGDELTANVTLYAKWYTPTTWCEDIANAIREKEGSSEPIKHLDFPARILAIESAPSGYTVVINASSYNTSVGYLSYSFDNGTTWSDIMSNVFPLILNNIQQIKFKITVTGSAYCVFFDDTNSTLLLDGSSSKTTSNIVLSANNAFRINIYAD